MKKVGPLVGWRTQGHQKLSLDITRPAQQQRILTQIQNTTLINLIGCDIIVN